MSIKLYLISFFVFNFSLSAQEVITPERLSQVKIRISEPSALAFSSDKKTLWTVSDTNGKIYSLGLNGQILNEIQTRSSDLEGVVAHADLGGLCFAEERIKKVSCIDQNGRVTLSKTLPLEGRGNSGIEGLTYNPDNQRFYVVIEKEPTLIAELDRNLNVIGKKTVQFAKDLSDIFYDEHEKKLWVLSHESQKAFKLDSQFQIEQVISLSGIVQAEGLVVDSLNKKIYVVSDKDSLFYTFSY